jgi:hypothetical protein
MGETPIFDKIINLKFVRRSRRSFTIRSDYEPVFHAGGRVSFKKCAQKPDIKIKYKQVAEGVAIEVDIYITNYFAGGEDTLDKESVFTAGGDPIVRCIIQMGYRDQFPDWTQPERAGNANQFYDLNNHAITNEAEVRRGNQITVQILTGYPQSYPPDRVVYFKGIIGTFDKGLRWNHTAADLIKGYGDPNFPANRSEIEDVLFQFVTRRFIRPSILHTVETNENATNLEDLLGTATSEVQQRIMIYEYERYKNPSETDALIFARALNPSEGAWQELVPMDNGIMSIEDAYLFGIRCIVSNTLRSHPANSLFGYGLTEEQAANLRPIPATPFDDERELIGGQLNALQWHYPYLRWYILPDGSYYFYHDKDTDADLIADAFITDQKKEPIFLPAIYDMTPQGTRSIRCPFLSFISPMSTVLFESRYSIGTETSFFYPPSTNAFLVIIVTAEFATVQDDNLVELMCVDQPRIELTPSVPVPSIAAPAEEDEVPEVARMQDLRNLQWIERELTVVRYRTDNTETGSSWENIVNNDVLTAKAQARWPEDTVLTETMALEHLMEDNPDFFDLSGRYMARGFSIENRPEGIGGRTGIKVPWLHIGDKITIRHPFQPEYPEGEKVG